MIEKISLKIASYREAASLETDKKINFIYGLNGSGKSTLSEFLRHCHEKDNEKYISCSIQPKLREGETILVYNQKWVTENFYVNPELKGIFSLSKENVEAKKAIDHAKHEKIRLENLETEKNRKLEESKTEFLKRKNNVLDSIWKIKSNYAGGSRKTEYCLRGLMGSKEVLFNYLLNVKKPECVPTKNIDAISKEFVSMLDEHVAKIDRIADVEFYELNEQEKALLRKEITGSENSTFSTLIDELKNSDWVNLGIKYIESRQGVQKCPFCQQNIDREQLLANLKLCFDRSYESDKAELNRIYDSYKSRVEALSENPIFNTQNLLQEFSGRYKVAFAALRNTLFENVSTLNTKKQTPSLPVALKAVEKELSSVNRIIEEANKTIRDFNNKIDQKEKTLSELKELFWQNLRLEYDAIISNYERDLSDTEAKKKSIENELSNIRSGIDNQELIITNESKKTSNIEVAIKNINQRLVDLGIDNFQIEATTGETASYKLVRTDNNANNIFDSLSEGEKMIISFLYFIEECKGKEKADVSEKKKIIVIDDPISSLSHMYVFNIASLIKDEFIRKSDNWEQVFVLTHSIYFFYELAGQKKFSSKDLSEAQKLRLPNLFRIVKSSGSSRFVKMPINEIQNDYQMFWSVVNDKDNSPALVANCMRHIIDYFFGFIEKKGLNDVFQKAELKDSSRFSAFNRYINRESHSDSTNIYDMKEFDSDSFYEAFRLVFELSGYKEHYDRMSKIGQK